MALVVSVCIKPVPRPEIAAPILSNSAHRKHVVLHPTRASGVTWIKPDADCRPLCHANGLFPLTYVAVGGRQPKDPALDVCFPGKLSCKNRDKREPCASPTAPDRPHQGDRATPRSRLPWRRIPVGRRLRTASATASSFQATVAYPQPAPTTRMRRTGEPRGHPPPVLPPIGCLRGRLGYRWIGDLLVCLPDGLVDLEQPASGPCPRPVSSFRSQSAFVGFRTPCGWGTKPTHGW